MVKNDWKILLAKQLSVELGLKIPKELIQFDQDVVVVFVYPPPRRAVGTTEIMTLTAI